jgi:hypothetical protein
MTATASGFFKGMDDNSPAAVQTRAGWFGLRMPEGRGASVFTKFGA